LGTQDTCICLYGYPHAVQNAVDKGTGFFGAEAFADIDGLVDRDFGGMSAQNSISNAAIRSTLRSTQDMRESFQLLENCSITESIVSRFSCTPQTRRSKNG
jgi:hypothetical protein